MKKKIVIASVLKPVNDARMYEKIAISLSRLPDSEVHVAGYKSQEELSHPSVVFHPLFSFKRISFGRLIAPWKFYNLLIKVKPQFIIVTTHDLLIVTCIYRILFGGKIIYDVQENYYRNIAFTGTFPPVIRHLIALSVRAIEYLTHPFICRYILAEKCYEKELGFTKGKSIIIENKARKSSTLPPTAKASDGKIRLLYSGTIAEVYGVFEAVELSIELHRLNPAIYLTIIGYSSKEQTLAKLRETIKPYDFIELKGRNQLVPHQQILEEIQKADFGLVSYIPNKSTENCIPTKLYEYLAYKLPMIIQHNPLWNEIAERNKAGISIDYSNFKPKELLSKIQKERFYPHPIAEDNYWESEEPKLLNLLNSIL